MKECVMVLFHYLCLTVHHSLELPMLRLAAQGSEKHIIVFAFPRVFEIHRKINFEKIYFSF